MNHLRHRILHRIALTVWLWWARKNKMWVTITEEYCKQNREPLRAFVKRQFGYWLEGIKFSISCFVWDKIKLPFTISISNRVISEKIVQSLGKKEAYDIAKRILREIE